MTSLGETDKTNVIRRKGKKDAMSNDGTQGNNNRRNEMRKRITSKNWIEKNGQPGEK